MSSWWIFSVFCANFLFLASGSFIVNPGPKVIATKGHPCPLPKEWLHKDEFYTINTSKFSMEILGGINCTTLLNATERYSKIVSEMAKSADHLEWQSKSEDWENTLQYRVSFWDCLIKSGFNLATNCAFGSYQLHRVPLRFSHHDNFYQGEMTQLRIVLERECEFMPQLNMDESYSLEVSSVSTLQSNSIWGVLRGLETFSQLIYRTTSGRKLLINATVINDAPQYSHRGLLLDTSRHYIRPETIRKILDGMSYLKLNVFHWHIVDDQSFPFVSQVYPELSGKGAYRPDLVYTSEMFNNITEHARLRGIRVMAEFDTPGHTRSWGLSHLELLTKCYGKYEGSYGPMDPTRNSTFHFILNLFREVRARFNDNFFHLGSDEVDFECWKSNAEVVAYMNKQGYGKDFAKLQNEFVSKVVAMVEGMDAVPVVWEEALNENLSKKAIVHVWKRDRPMEVMRDATKAGHRAILSSGWYLDRLINSSDVLSYLKNDPRSFDGTEEQKKLVLGGEACMWSELVDDDNVLQRIFTRVAATAERLWSHDFSNLDYALQRIEEQNCRLKQRKIPTQPPNGPGFC